MFTAGDFHTKLIHLMHRAGRGENITPELDDVIVRLEQTKSFQNLPDWRQSIINIRGSLMTHFVGPLSSSQARKTDPAEIRRVAFVEEAIGRLATLMADSMTTSESGPLSRSPLPHPADIMPRLGADAAADAMPAR